MLPSGDFSKERTVGDLSWKNEEIKEKKQPINCNMNRLYSCIVEGGGGGGERERDIQKLQTDR